MRRLSLSVLALLITSMAAFCQTTIVMEEEDGLYKIPCTVNGARMKFVFDTGATTVCLSGAMAEYLYENDYISKDDIVGLGKSEVADGSIVDHLEIILRDVEIVGLHLHDVEAVVIKGQRAPLLLGQSAISKLGRITIDGKVMVIDTQSNGMADDFEALVQRAHNYFSDRIYGKAQEFFDKAYFMGELSLFDLNMYLLCCIQNKDYSTAERVADRLPDLHEFVDNGINIYATLAPLYSDTGRIDDTIACYKKAAEVEKLTTKSNVQAAMSCYLVALLEFDRKNYREASEYSLKAVREFEEYYELEEGYLFDDCYGLLSASEKSYRNRLVDDFFYLDLKASYKGGILSVKDYRDLMRQLARNGNASAINACDELGIRL